MALLRLNNFSERDLDLTLSYGAGLMLNQKLNSSHYVASGYVCQKPECGIITIRSTVIASFAKITENPATHVELPSRKGSSAKSERRFLTLEQTRAFLARPNVIGGMRRFYWLLKRHFVLVSCWP